MEEFVTYLVKNLVSNPDKVKVTLEENDGEVELEVRVGEDDVGQVIGRKGNTINALRTITRVVAARLGKRVHLEVMREGEEARLKKTAQSS